MSKNYHQFQLLQFNPPKKNISDVIKEINLLQLEQFLFFATSYRIFVKSQLQIYDFFERQMKNNLQTYFEHKDDER